MELPNGGDGWLGSGKDAYRRRDGIQVIVRRWKLLNKNEEKYYFLMFAELWTVWNHSNPS